MSRFSALKCLTIKIKLHPEEDFGIQLPGLPLKIFKKIPKTAKDAGSVEKGRGCYQYPKKYQEMLIFKNSHLRP